MSRRGEPLPFEVQQLLAPFFIGFDLSRIRIIEGIPRYVALTSKIDPLGYTDGWKIYFAPDAYRIDTVEGLALLAHEIEHCRQYQQHGKWRFRAKYLAAYFQNRRQGLPGKQAYHKIPFEIEAREVERKVYLALMRLQSEFLPIE